MVSLHLGASCKIFSSIRLVYSTYIIYASTTRIKAKNILCI